MRFIRKHSDVWGAIVIGLAMYYAPSLIRQYYDWYTPDVSGSFYTSKLYQLFGVVIASLFAWLAIRFQFMNTLGGYYFDKAKDQQHSQFYFDWHQAGQTPHKLWRIVIVLSVWLCLSYFILHATVGTQQPTIQEVPPNLSAPLDTLQSQ